MKKYLITLLTICFLANTVLSGFVPRSETSNNKTNFRELSKILGEKVVICTDTNSKHFYISTFERLDQEQNQKLKKQIDIATAQPSAADSKYINDVHSAYMAALHTGAVKPYETILNKEWLRSFHHSSRAPPQYS